MSVTYQELLEQTSTINKCINYALLTKLLPTQDSQNCVDCKHAKCVKWFAQSDSDNLPYRLKCSRCGKKTPLTAGTWFRNGDLSLCTAIRITLLFVYNMSVQMTAYELNTTEKMITNYFNWCRQVCYAIVNHNGIKVGGPNHVVEIEEFCLFGDKSGSSNAENKKIWLLGGIDRHSKECFIVPVKITDKETLQSLMRKHINIGSRIVSSLWEKSDINNEFFDLKYDVVYPDSFINHTHNIKRLWRTVRTMFKKRTSDEYSVILKLSEFLYFRQNSEPRMKQYCRFLQDIALVFPGYGRKGLQLLQKCP